MSGKAVLILGTLPKNCFEKLSKVATVTEFYRENSLDQDKMVELLTDKDAVVSEPLDHITPEVMDRCKRLKVVSNRAVGFDNVNLEEATRRGILVSNTPGVLDAATADLAFTLFLAVCRRVVEADRYVRAGKWSGYRSDLMLGPDIHGKTMGIVGMGRIGTAFAERARAFGMDIVYTRFSEPDSKDQEYKERLKAKRVDLHELLKTSDFVSLHCPYSPSTHHLLGEDELDLMKPQAILINTARGKVIDENALVKHLEEKRIFGAGLDVFENEPHVPEALIALDNVVLAPHIGSACIDTRRKMTEMSVDAILDAFNGQRPTNLLNKEAWNSFSGNLESNSNPDKAFKNG